MAGPKKQLYNESTHEAFEPIVSSDNVYYGNDEEQSITDMLASSGVPTIDLRVVRDMTTRTSSLFGSRETAPIYVDRLQYRINATAAQVDALKSAKWRVCLYRARQKTRNGIKIVDWSVADAGYGNRVVNPYPTQTTFDRTGQNSGGICWCSHKLSPFDLPVGYDGDWLNLPYDMEAIMRRYVYFARHYFGTENIMILPMDDYKPSIDLGNTKDSAAIHLSWKGQTQCVFGAASDITDANYRSVSLTEGKQMHVSLLLGIGISLYTGGLGVKNEQYIKGPITRFNGIIRRRGISHLTSTLHYTAKLYGINKPNI